MIREVTRFLTCDGKVFESPAKAELHAKTMLENRIGAMFDMLTKGANVPAQTKLTMLNNAMQNPDALLHHMEVIRATIEWE